MPSNQQAPGRGSGVRAFEWRRCSMSLQVAGRISAIAPSADDRPAGWAHGQELRMDAEDQTAGIHLLDKGTLVEFETLAVDVIEGIDDAEFGMHITLRLGLEEDANDVEWGGLGFCYVLAALSFADARPRGASELEYEAEDQLTLKDFLEGLTYVRGELHYYGDYLRGRRLKTRIAVKPDGVVTLDTVGRGKVALRWLDRIKGRKTLQLVGEA